jgi:hypothetical protein
MDSKFESADLKVESMDFKYKMADSKLESMNFKYKTGNCQTQYNVYYDVSINILL